jgi:DNA polymerase-3 subunit beta
MRADFLAMKVTIERAALLRALGHVHRVVERRTTIPILANVLLSAKDGAGAKVADQALDAQVSLEATGDAGQLTLRSGRSRFNLSSLPESDFPDVTSGDFSHSFTLAPGDLKRLIEKTQFAISSEETRYYLNGIYVHTLDVEGQAMLRAVATDGHRLARLELPAPKGSAGMPGVILPRKAVTEVQRLIEDAQGDVLVELSTNKMRFTFGDALLTTKLIDGTFPDYARVIPAGNDKRLTVERDAFAKAVDRVSTISSERGRAVKLALSEGKLVLSVTNPDQGSAVEELEADYDGPPLDIGFNARYLLDITQQLDSDTALFKLADPGSPTLVQDRDGASALYVLMPMRV